MLRQQMLRRGRQRGVALITAVLMVALATILAINVTFRGMVDQRRSSNLFAFDQGFEVALGAEAWAADFLRHRIRSRITSARPGRRRCRRCRSTKASARSRGGSRTCRAAST
jgi:type II secretory pathway component PulK